MDNTPAYRQQWILEELKKSPLLSFGEVFTLYLQNFTKKLSRQTLSKDYNTAKEQLQAYQKKANEEKERVSIELEKEAVKQGLKTKFDRLMDLQQQWNNLKKTLDVGVIKDFYVHNGMPKEFDRKLTIKEITTINRIMKDISAEISKIEGDYASDKLDVFIEQPLFGD